MVEENLKKKKKNSGWIRLLTFTCFCICYVFLAVFFLYACVSLSCTLVCVCVATKKNTSSCSLESLIIINDRTYLFLSLFIFLLFVQFCSFLLLSVFFSPVFLLSALWWSPYNNLSEGKRNLICQYTEQS